MDAVDGFILTRSRRDGADGIEYTLWLATDRGSVRVLVSRQDAVFFIERDAPAVPGALRESVSLATLEGRPVDALYFRSFRKLRAVADALETRGARTYEADVKPEDRYLMERFVRGAVSIEGYSRAGTVSSNASILFFDRAISGHPFRWFRSISKPPD
jgi:DNA polymerase II